MKSLASAGFEADLARRGTKFQRRMESPTPFNLLLWRSVVDRGNEFWVGYRSVFERDESPVRWTIYPKGDEALAGLTEMRETKTLVRFTDGWWIARPNATGAWLADMRFPEARTWGSKKGMVDSRLALSWLINPAAKSDHLRRISADGLGRGLAADGRENHRQPRTLGGESATGRCPRKPAGIPACGRIDDVCRNSSLSPASEWVMDCGGESPFHPARRGHGHARRAE